MERGLILLSASRLGASDSEPLHLGDQRRACSPSRAAAPFGPPTTQLVAARARMMCSRSTSLSVVKSSLLSAPTMSFVGGDCCNSSRDGRKIFPGERMTARSMTFCNSRTFPGQGWRNKTSIASTGISVIRLFALRSKARQNGGPAVGCLPSVPERRHTQGKNIQAII